MKENSILTENLKNIISDFESGKSLRQMEKDYGINRKLISAKLKEIGYEFKREYSNEIKEAAIKMLSEGKSITKIAEALHIERHQLSLNFQKWNKREQINPKNHIGNFQNNDQDKEIANRYIEGESIKTLSLDYNCSTNYIYRILNKYNISEKDRVYRKYIYDQDVFEIIDTEEKAYWLGFLYADGCVYYSQYNNRYSVEIGLQYRDSCHVENFSHFINPTENPFPVIYNKENNKCIIKIYNKKICKDLIKKGCIQRKSLILKFPNESIVPDHLLHHFIRGAFDGDGCIHIANPSKPGKRKKRRPQLVFSYIGSYDFCTGMQNALLEHNAINNITKLHKRNNVYSFANGGNLQCKKIFDFLYKDATIYLKRKYDKFIAVLGENT